MGWDGVVVGTLGAGGCGGGGEGHTLEAGVVIVIGVAVVNTL